jgi:hypothetical protein
VGTGRIRKKERCGNKSESRVVLEKEEVLTGKAYVGRIGEKEVGGRS